MSANLERLIRLAKKTGDTLIIHDQNSNRDLVLLDVDQYEMMVDSSVFFGHSSELRDQGIHELTERGLLDKINRDISIWRSQKELDEEWQRNEHLDRHMAANPLPDPFEEDFTHHADWHDAGSVLEDRYKDTPWNYDGDGDVWEDEKDFDDLDTIKIEDIPNFDQEIDFGEVDWSSDDELQSIPFSSENLEEAWEDEPLLDEDPIFFEEPI